MEARLMYGYRGYNKFFGFTAGAASAVDIIDIKLPEGCKPAKLAGSVPGVEFWDGKVVIDLLTVKNGSDAAPAIKHPGTGKIYKLHYKIGTNIIYKSEVITEGLDSMRPEE